MHTLTTESAQKENVLDASLWAQSDLLLTSAFIQAIKDIKVGRLVPDSILQKDSSLRLSFFKMQFENFGESSINNFVASLEPKHAGYHQLKSALQFFLPAANFKKYTYINIKNTFELPALVAKRLSEEDSIEISATDSLSLAAAIKKYQIAKGIKADGKIGPQLAGTMNKTDDEKFTQVAITLDRYKQLQPLPSEYIW